MLLQIAAFLIFILILSILIVVHEWGHYITARKCGVRVEQFALGFGPKLFGWMHDGTEFCLCAIPLGGYVKMAGDERDKCTGLSDEYFSKPVGQRALVVFMGPVVNLVLAFVCFWLVFMIGYVDMDASSPKGVPVIGQVLEGSPAKKADLQFGDKVVSINGTPVTQWSQLQDIISTSTTPQLAFVVERKGQMISKTLAPEQQAQKDIFGREHNTRRIGVGPVSAGANGDLVVTRYGPIQSFGKAGEELLSIAVKTYTALYEMLIGARSPKEAMGIVGMFFVIKFALTVGFSFVLHIVGVISASLAIFNLLPIIPLDGGHLFLLGVEKLRGRTLSSKTDLMIAKVGFTLIITLALFVFYVDFERIGLIDKVMHLFKGTGL